MSIQAVKEYLKPFEMDHKIQEFTVSSATVALAAEALGVEGARIAKSLAFACEDGALLVVAAGDARVDNAGFRAAFGRKASMLSPEQTLELVGHAVGGVCPFALKSGVKVYLDESLKRFQTVFPACGSANSAIELTMDDLEKLSGALGWVDVCKSWRESEGGI